MENRTPRPDHPPAREAQQPPTTDAYEGREEPDDTPGVDNEPVSLGADIGFDRVVASEEAGLGGGLDQAEEAQLGVTDEELAKRKRGQRTTNG
jgi:hypothetical protein